MTTRRAYTVELTDEQIQAIEAKVASGDYASPSDVVAAGVAELDGPAFIQDRSPEWLAFLARTRETIARLDAGIETTYSVEEVRRRIAERRACEDQCD